MPKDVREVKETFEDYPLSEVPLENRKGFFSLSVVLLGFTFFSSTMWAGGQIGVAFKLFPDLISIIFIGNLLLGAFVAVLGYIAFKSGLNTVLMCRFSFGDHGSKFTDILFGFTQICWYAWGTAIISVILVELTGIDKSYSGLLMIIFGMTFCYTAIVGYKGLEILSIVSVPLMILLIFISMWVALKDVGGIDGLVNKFPKTNMSYETAVTIVFATFISGGIQATNWTRFASSSKAAIFSSLTAFMVGNGLMVVVGAVGALVYNEPDITNVFKMQSLLSMGIIMLFLNIWTTQDNTIYNFSVAGCNLLRTSKRKLITIVGAIFGSLIALLGIYEWLVPFLILLGTFIPPVGGIIIADFFVKHKKKFPSITNGEISKYNYAGLTAYAGSSAAAYFSPFSKPLTGIVLSFIIYVLLVKSSKVFSSES